MSTPISYAPHTNVAIPTLEEKKYLERLENIFRENGERATVDGRVLVGVGEIKNFLGLKRATTVTNWQARAFDNNFPDPLAILLMGPVYDLRDVIAWYIHWKPRYGVKVGQLPDLDEWFSWLQGDKKISA